jgi:anti-sigma B factor antagonist
MVESAQPRIAVEYTDDAVIISFTDEKILESKDVQVLKDSIMGVIEQAEGINLLLDFSKVKFLSSSVLGLLINISKRIYEQNGQMKLCNISDKIYEIFKITRLTKIFDIYEDRETALKSFDNKES